MTENILQEADKLTLQDRRREYGPASEEFERAAVMWSTLLKKKLKEPITADEYAMCMVLVKVIRYSYKPSRDSLVDIAGYTRTIEMLGEETTDQFFQRQYESTQTSVRQNYDPTSGPCPQCKRCLCLKCKNWHAESQCRPLAVTPAMPSCGDQRILVGSNISAEHAEAAGYTRRHVSVEEMHKAQLPENSELAVPWTMSGLQSPFAKLAVHYNISQSDMVRKMYEEPVLVPEELREEIWAHNIAFGHPAQLDAKELMWRTEQEKASQRYQRYIEQSARSPLEQQLDAFNEAFINSGEVPKEIPANAGDEAMAAQAFIQGSDR